MFALQKPGRDRMKKKSMELDLIDQTIADMETERNELEQKNSEPGRLLAKLFKDISEMRRAYLDDMYTATETIANINRYAACSLCTAVSESEKCDDSDDSDDDDIED